MLISLTTDKPMMFGGTEERCAFGELISIGGLVWAWGTGCHTSAGWVWLLGYCCRQPRCIARRPRCVSSPFYAGAIGGEKNKKISAALAEVVQRHLGVPPSRLYIKVPACAVAAPRRAAEAAPAAAVRAAFSRRPARAAPPADVRTEPHAARLPGPCSPRPPASPQFFDVARTDFGYNGSTF